jgi:Tfp pilus assembly protein PilF
VPGKQFHLGAAASALVTHAHAQSRLGHHDLAASTIERALRIEPENPLLWIELGHVRMDEGHAAQADGLYRKALSLAAGDSQIQASAWLLIAETLRARGRNLEAADAERRAASAAPH